MNKTLTLLLSLLFMIVGLSSKLSATHIMGGEITWECQANGQYVFTLKVYRDCNGIAFNSNNHALEVHNYPNLGNISQIPVDFFSVTDITPACEGSPCGTLVPSDPDIAGAIEEYILVSDPVTLNGVPGANGWTFTWTYGDRNAAIDNILNAQTFGITLRAQMFAYNGRDAGTCFDNSPNFFQKPSSIICAGEKFTYNHSAYDRELDSLVYSWANPLDGNFCGAPPCIIGALFVEDVTPVNVNFDAGNGYAFDSPYPDTSQDSRNVPAVLDAQTGEITYTSFNSGEFVSVIRVEAFKCGQKVAEIYRELQTVITSGCASNESPVIPSPFANNTYFDTVKAGELINFDISVFDTLRTGNPKDDSIFFYASGIQFGDNFTSDTSGCLNPPCATLSSPAPDTGVGIYTTTFNWQTTCDHVANNTPDCITSQNSYLFIIRALDDFCPTGGQALATFAITILEDTLVKSPPIHCADVQANGDVIIDWNQTPDPDSAFVQWKIYRSTNLTDTFDLIDSVMDYNVTTYTDVNSGANNQSIHYIVRAQSGCHQNWFYLNNDTISTMYIEPTFNDTCVFVSWNELSNPLPDSSGSSYDIYREYPIGSGFTLYKSIVGTSFCDTFNVCTDSVTYRIDISNTGNGCSGSSSNTKGIRFQYPIVTAATALIDSVTCNGFNNGTAMVNTAGGTEPFDYLWSDSQTNDTAFNLSAGTYSVIVSDLRNCADTAAITIIEPPAFLINSVDTFDISCNGLSDGRAKINASGGRMPYTYFWSNSQFTDSAINLAVGTYRVTVLDNQSCVQIAQVEINEPPVLSVTISDSTMVSCNGLSDAIAVAAGAGGTPPYTYLWSDNQTADTANNLSAGTYTVTVSDANNCSATATTTITEPTILSAAIGDTINVSCNGLSDGQTTVIASGGTSPFTYLWSDNQSTDTAFNLLAANYTVTVSDSNGCTSTATVTISEPSILTTTTTVNSTVSCNGLNDGSAFTTAVGGTGPYTYLWSNNQTADTAQSLSEGTYRVTVSDNNGCSTIDSVSITEPASLATNIIDSTDVTCNGLSDGSATISATGGTTPYTYLWSDSQTAATASNLTAGVYSVTVSDNNGCSFVDSIRVNEPALLQASISDSSNVSCNGLSNGLAVASGVGGTSPYTYLWSDNQTADTANNLSAGTYTVTVSDANNCSATATTTITEPTILSAAIGDTINVSCNGLSDGQTTVIASGGTSPFTYLWSDNQSTDTAFNLLAANYTVTVSDSNGCTSTATVTISEPSILTTTTTVNSTVSCNGLNDGSAFTTAVGGTGPYTYLWSNNQTADTAQSLSEGTYRVTVSDNNGCSVIDSVIITEPASLVTNVIDSTDVSCNGLSDGSAIISATGGTTPYTYLWSDSQTAATASNLTAGVYSVTVSDNNGCSFIDSIRVNEPALLQASISDSSNVSCNGLSNGLAVVSGIGGTSPYTYLWSDNQTGDTAINLSAGNYVVTLSDTNGCSTTAATVITEPTILSAAIGDTINVSCNGLSDGQATVVASGGTVPYSYSWSDNQVTDTAFNLSAGSYTVTVSDSNNCSITSSFLITEPNLLTTTTVVSANVSCQGLMDGTAYVTANGGTIPYTYLWSNSQLSDTARNLVAGKYRVTVSDANGCLTIDSVRISQPPVLGSTLSSSRNVSCFNQNNGSALVSASGGTQPYTYSWNNNATTQNISGLGAGIYIVTITDANACNFSDTVLITEPEELVTDLTVEAISCFGLDDGKIIAQSLGGTQPFTYIWSTNQLGDSIENLNPGSYFVTTSDLNNCTVFDTIEVIEPSEITLNISADDTVCVNVPKQLDARATGGTGAYTYSWSDNLGNDSSISVSPTQNKIYKVSVTDANNCPSVSQDISIKVRNIFDDSLSLSSSGNICLGDSSVLSYYFEGDFDPYTFSLNNGLPNLISQKVSPPTTTNYIITVSDICMNSIQDSVLIEVSDPPTINLSDTLIDGCEDLTVRFTNQTPLNYVYLWDFGNGITSRQANPVYTYTEPGTYSVDLEVSTPQGCISNSSANYLVQVNPRPNARITANPTVTDIENSTISFSSFYSDASGWLWTFANGDTSSQQSPTTNYNDTGSYRVSLWKVNLFGCRDTGYQVITINPNYEIKIPNVFTPNTNGSNGGRYDPNSTRNEVFHPYLEYTEEYRLQIFNRWGELVFESKDVNIGWDGYYKNQLSQADVYVYKLEVTFINGAKATKVGDLTLLR